MKTDLRQLLFQELTQIPPEPGRGEEPSLVYISRGGAITYLRDASNVCRRSSGPGQRFFPPLIPLDSEDAIQEAIAGVITSAVLPYESLPRIDGLSLGRYFHQTIGAGVRVLGHPDSRKWFTPEDPELFAHRGVPEDLVVGTRRILGAVLETPLGLGIFVESLGLSAARIV